jgi:hypothetical protein
MRTDRTTVLLIVSRDSLDRARALAGRATTTLKLAVSLQIVLRGLIAEGLKRPANPALLRNIERQAPAVREIRAAARRAARGAAARRKTKARVP